MSDLDSRYLTVPQVAAELQMDVSAVYKMCKSQQLPSVRFGKSVRIPRLAYERYLQRLEGGRPELLELESRDSQDRLEDFPDATGHDPDTWIDGWRSGSIPDTPENTRLAIHALGLREATRQRATQTAALP
ncbi:MAG TPA: helix-turn-helix domain-containing protein [Solirubrobacteraceae bacterium]|nr:helix-turn-helix domain-containing protein [Solirubrobacteraceae bacterium]